MQENFTGNIADRPEPLPRADHGRWTSYAEKFFEDSDHLVRVAGITVGQIKKLKEAGIRTMAALGAASGTSVPKLAADSFEKLVAQARLQCQTGADRLLRPDAPARYEVLPQVGPNLLHGYYQVRNLVVRFLLDESIKPELLFRRAANERAAALLQDTETMLRQVLAAVLGRIGPDAAREKLQAMPQPGEVIDKELNRALLAWAKENCQPEAVKEFNGLLLKYREAVVSGSFDLVCPQVLF